MNERVALQITMSLSPKPERDEALCDLCKSIMD